jgi:hypothetical protein
MPATSWRSKCSGNQRGKSVIVVSRPKHRSIADPLVQMPKTSEVKTNLELDRPQDSATKADSTPWAPTPPSATREQQLTALHSPPTTPPPDSDFDSESHLIDGVACQFSAMLPSRVDLLSMESESATETRAARRAASEPPCVSDTGCVFGLVDSHRVGYPTLGQQHGHSPSDIRLGLSTLRRRVLLRIASGPRVPRLRLARPNERKPRHNRRTIARKTGCISEDPFLGTREHLIIGMRNSSLSTWLRQQHIQSPA